MSKVNMFKQVLSDSSDLTKEVVKRIIGRDFNKLNDDIANDIVDDVIDVIQDTIEYGCSSGVCSPFIYTSDNVEFLKENLEEIFELLSDLEYAHYSVDKAYDVDAMVWTSIEHCLSVFMDNYNYLIEYDEE